jgi:HK97 gp10 family phage protein
MNAQLQSELNALIRDLQGVSDTARRDTNRVLTEAAGPLRAAIQGRAPVSLSPHKRYNTPKILGKLRAPKGSGRVVATYQPGNLGKSFSILNFRRAKNAKFIGPRLDKSGGGRTPDGYYAHMVEFGTVNQSGQHFVEQAVSAVGPATLRFASELMRRAIDQYAKSKNLQ